MKNQPGQCNRCKAVLMMVEEAGIRWTLDAEPVDAQEATEALLAGRQLYSVHRDPDGNVYRLSTPSPAMLGGLRDGVTQPSGLRGEGSVGRPEIRAEHPCPSEAARSLLATPGGGTVPGKAPRPSAGRTAAFSGHSIPDPAGAVDDQASSTPSRSDGTRPPGPTHSKPDRPGGPTRPPWCDGCGEPCADGTYASVELGDTVIWAAHLEACPN